MAVTSTLDARGAEQRTETGVGRIVKVEPKGERNAFVEIDADHLRDPVTGWVDMRGPVWARVTEAHSSGASIWYRVDVHRKADVPVGTPLVDVDRRSKVRDLVAVLHPAEAPATVPVAGPAQNRTDPESTGGQERPAGPPAGADPQAGSGAAQGRTAASALDAGRAVLVGALQGRGNAATVQEAIRIFARAGGSLEQVRKLLGEYHAPWFADDTGLLVTPDHEPAPDGGPRQSYAVSPVSGLSRRSQPVATDGKPWDPVNSDGRVNLSSYAASAVFEVTVLAGKLLVTRARNLYESDPDAHPLEAPPASKVRGLAVLLLGVADEIQATMRGGGRTDRMAQSHRLARQALREGLDLFSVPWDADADGREVWKQALVEHGTTLATVAVELLEDRTSVPQPAAGA